MTPKQEILIRLAREAMEDLRGYRKGIDVAIAAIDEALTEPEEKYQYGTPLLDAMTGKAEQPAQHQEPVAYIRKDQLQKAAQSPMLCEVTPEPRQDRIGIFTSPQSKPWVGLTEEDRLEIWKKSTNIDGAINATATKLREKNA